MTIETVLDQLAPLLETFRSRACETDRSRQLPRQHLEELGRIGVYRLGIAVDRGGLGAPPEVLWEVSESLAAACATTHFVQAQHQGALGFLLRSPRHELLDAAYLDGRRLCGVAFAHLRRPHSPLTVQQDGDSYLLRGQAPWMSGWNLMDDVVIAGRDGQNQDLYFLAELSDSSLQARQWPLLGAIEASNTVSLEVSDLKVPASRLVLSQTLEEMARRDFRAQLGYAALPLGLVREACRRIEEGRPGHAAVAQLAGRAARLRQRALAWTGDDGEALDIRAESNLLGLQAAQAVVVAAGGSANQLYHPASRMLREASFYFLSQLNEPLRDTVLTRLSEGVL